MIQRNLRLFWFLLYFFVVGPENSRQPLKQSDVKLKKKRITNWSPSFSRASSASACFHLESLLANDDVNLKKYPLLAQLSKDDSLIRERFIIHLYYPFLYSLIYFGYN